ncbi:MAG: phosphatase PAP2 family protein [Syntrophobacterales bacterium]|jgi:hypothetical protein
MKSLVRASILIVMVLVASRASADVINDWWDIAFDAVRVDNTCPPVAARTFGIMGASIFDSVNAIDRTYEVYKVRTAPIWRNASQEAAVATAAYLCLSKLFPRQSFQSQYQESLAAIPWGKGKLKGIVLGTLVSTKMLIWRAFDGSNRTVNYQPTNPPVPGRWQPTPEAYDPFWGPQWGKVTPFAITSGDQFRAPPPPDLNSPEYTAAFNEVKEIGAKNSSTRTAEQTQIAQFWSNQDYTETPPGHFIDIALDVADSQGLTLAEKARLMGLLGIAEADAGIAAWDTKVFYDTWRPSTAITATGDLADNNPGTIEDPNWKSVYDNPPFASYVSGHTVFGWAWAAVMADFFGTDEIEFSTTSDTLGPDVIRYFDSFSEAATENGLSRIYLGVHFPFDNDFGIPLGEQIGDYVFANYMQPVHTPLPSTLMLFGSSLLGLGALGWWRRKS